MLFILHCHFHLDSIQIKKKSEILLENILARLYVYTLQLSFAKLWRNTRRKFRLFHSTDGFTTILQENGRFTPRSSTIISNYPFKKNRSSVLNGTMDRNEIVINKEIVSQKLPNGRWVTKTTNYMTSSSGFSSSSSSSGSEINSTVFNGRHNNTRDYSSTI